MKTKPIRTDVRTGYEHLKSIRVRFLLVSDFLKTFEAKVFLCRRKSRESPGDFRRQRQLKQHQLRTGPGWCSKNRRL